MLELIKSDLRQKLVDELRTLTRNPSVIINIIIMQGWAQELLGRDRDQDRDLSYRDRARRDRDVCQTVRDETLECPRRDFFLVETISRHMAYICMVYALHTVSRKKNPLD